jgi:ABC-type sugar transport system substrate-binding protein
VLGSSRGRSVGFYAALLCVIAASLAVSACGSEDGGGSGGGGDEGSAEGKKVTLISCTNENPWCNAFNKNIEQTAAQGGVDTTLLTSNFDSAAQAQQFSQAISQNPDAILVHIADPNAVVPSLLKAQRADVPVIAVDVPVKQDAQELLASTLKPDHFKLGQFAAENIQEGLEKQGVERGNVIAITGTGSQLHVQQRMQAFKTQMEKTPEYKIVEIQDGNWDPIQTGTIGRQLLAKYKNQGGIQGAYGMADYQGAAISRAAKQAGIPLYPEANQGLVVTGSNCAGVGVAAIRKGEMYGGATQSPIVQGRETAKFTLRFLKGEDIGDEVTTTVDRVTRDNVDEFADVCSY